MYYNCFKMMGRFQMEKPEQIYVPGIGMVREGQIVDVPEHRIKLLTEGGETDLICPSRKGRVYFEGGVPYYVAVVECLNANNLKARVQCPKKWRSK